MAAERRGRDRPQHSDSGENNTIIRGVGGDPSWWTVGSNCTLQREHCLNSSISVLPLLRRTRKRFVLIVFHPWFRHAQHNPTWSLLYQYNCWQLSKMLLSHFCFFVLFEGLGKMCSFPATTDKHQKPALVLLHSWRPHATHYLKI